MDETPAQLDIADDIARFAEMGVLGRLLMDRSTGRNIIWASNVFVDKGESYAPSDEILLADITGDNAGLIRTRASKAKEAQTALTRAHAEVFTPTWIVKKMVDAADEAWWEAHPDATWQDYVRSPRLEITCGEAPYLVSRYDAADGTPIPVDERVGILDRKLRLVSENTTNQQKWAMWALVALKSTYGYEYQGDNLLIARINVLATMEEFAAAVGYELKAWSYRQVVNVISWNLWQMDGLKDTVPEREITSATTNLDMDVIPGIEEFVEPVRDDMQRSDIDSGTTLARLFDWVHKAEIEFSTVKGDEAPMRFDYVIGNPPYQEDVVNEGDRSNPIYNHFMDAAYKVSDVVELIHPSRFLFNIGQTPKDWNKKMLADEHLKVLYYEEHAVKVFPNTEIKGGVVITLHDKTKDFGAIGLYIPYPELASIVTKTDPTMHGVKGLDSIIASQGLFRFSPMFFSEHPSAKKVMGKGTGAKIVSSVIPKLPRVFLEEKPATGEYIRLLARIRSTRVYRYVLRKYLVENEYMDCYKLFIPEANGTGRYGETLTLPELGAPLDGSADTYLNGGMFESEIEAINLKSYIMTKFLRALLGVHKVTQHCPQIVWSKIPLQDFSSDSDIDWSQSVADIDRQLYAKYNLSQDEIDFIESHVKEMQ